MRMRWVGHIASMTKIRNTYILRCRSHSSEDDHCLLKSPFSQWSSCVACPHPFSLPFAGLTRPLPCPAYSCIYHSLSVCGLFITLRMTVSSSEMSVIICQITWCYIPEYSRQHSLFVYKLSLVLK